MKLFYKSTAFLIAFFSLTSLVCLLGAGRFDFSARITLAMSAALWLWRVIYRRRGAKWARFCCRAFIAGFLALVISFAGVQGLIARTQLTAAQSAADLDLTRAPGSDASPTLIVFGAALRGSEPTRVLICRLESALDFLNTVPDSVAVLSGGLGDRETISEAEAMADWLVARGIDSSRLILEDASRNTEENILFSLSLVSSGAPLFAVSNGFHLYRINTLFTRQGAEAQLLSATMPNPGLIISMAIREYFAIIKMWVF